VKSLQQTIGCLDKVILYLFFGRFKNGDGKFVNLQQPTANVINTYGHNFIA
jgi:hypothetical protein